MSTDKLHLFRGITEILFIYLVISYTVIDAKTITKRDSEDVGESRSEEGEDGGNLKPVQERGANFPTVKKDLELEGSRSDIEPDSDGPAESEVGVSRTDDSVIGGESRGSDPDVPNDDPFHTTTEPKIDIEGLSNANIIVLDEQGNSSAVESKPEKETKLEISPEDSSSGSRSEIDPENTRTLEEELSKEEPAKSRGEAIETPDGTSRADSEALNPDSDEGSRASEELPDDSRSSDESDPSADSEGSRAEEAELDPEGSRSENLEAGIQSDDKVEEGHLRAAGIKDGVAKPQGESLELCGIPCFLKNMVEFFS